MRRWRSEDLPFFLIESGVMLKKRLHIGSGEGGIHMLLARNRQGKARKAMMVVETARGMKTVHIFMSLQPWPVSTVGPPIRSGPWKTDRCTVPVLISVCQAQEAEKEKQQQQPCHRDRRGFHPSV